MRTLKAVTLGCKVNQYETEYVRQGLLRAGFREVAGDEQADVCIINTCTVTVESDYKGRKLIRSLARENPRAEIIVMGCYATRAAEEVAALPGVVEVVTDKRRLPELLARHGVIEPPRGISSFGRMHRAYVKVQDGCRMDCTYCIIPQVRPVLWSRPVEEILDEIRRLVHHGHREIILTGIHLGHYGVEADQQHPDGCRMDLAGLVAKILEQEGEYRLRLSSLEASEVTPKLVALMAAHPDRVCPHLHIPLQSGSDAVLTRMRRPWSAGKIVERCGQLRASLDQPALTTDVIVGFPGETDEEFAATCRTVEEAGFSKLHIFRFSPREGTEAARMGHQVPPGVKQQRAAELTRIGERLQQQYHASLLGRELQVLLEGPVPDRPGYICGTADRYASVELPALPGQLDGLVQVLVQGTAADHIVAERI